MEARNHESGVLINAEEQHKRKPAKERSAQSPMEHSDSSWMLADSSAPVCDILEETAPEPRPTDLVPIHGCLEVAECVRGKL